MSDLISKGELFNALANTQDKGDIFAVIQNMPTKGLNSLAAEINQNSVDHGFWDEDRNFGEFIALCHSELSEALEEVKAGKPDRYYAETDIGDKPEGYPVELADCIIRILDWCGAKSIETGLSGRRWITTEAARTSMGRNSDGGML